MPCNILPDFISFPIKVDSSIAITFVISIGFSGISFSLRFLFFNSSLIPIKFNCLETSRLIKIGIQSSFWTPFISTLVPASMLTLISCLIDPRTFFTFVDHNSNPILSAASRHSSGVLMSGLVVTSTNGIPNRSNRK